MKIIFILLLGLLIIVPPAFGAPIADKTGLKFSFPINVDGNAFTIEGTANFDVKRLDFDRDSKKINLKIDSSLEENLMEIIVPKNLLEGDHLAFMITSIPTSVTQTSQLTINMMPVTPKMIHYGENEIFTTLEFVGIGTHYLSVSGSPSPDSFELVDELGYTASIKRRSEQSNTAVSSGAGTKTITFTKPFFTGTSVLGGSTNAYLPSVGINVNNMASGDYVEMGTVTSSQFQVTFKASNGSAVSRNFTWTATGYGKGV